MWFQQIHACDSKRCTWGRQHCWERPHDPQLWRHMAAEWWHEHAHFYWLWFQHDLTLDIDRFDHECPIDRIARQTIRTGGFHCLGLAYIIKEKKDDKRRNKKLLFCVNKLEKRDNGHCWCCYTFPSFSLSNINFFSFRVISCFIWENDYLKCRSDYKLQLVDCAIKSFLLHLLNSHNVLLT